MRSFLLALALLASPALLLAQDAQEQPTPLTQLADDLAAIAARIDEVDENLAAAPPETQGVFVFQRRRRWAEHHEVLGRLVEGIERVQGTPEEDTLVVGEAAAALQRELATVAVWIDDVYAEMTAVRQASAAAPPTDFVQAEIDLTELNADIDALLRAFSDDYDYSTVLGIDFTEEQAVHEAGLVERTELIGAALERALEERVDYREWVTKPGVDTVVMNLRMAATEERILGATTSLQAMVQLMDRSGLEAADYRQLIVSATGQLGTEVLDTRVLGGLIAQWSSTLADWFMANVGVMVLRLVAVLVIVFLASRLSRVVRHGATRFLSSKRIDLSSLIKNLVIGGLSKLVWVIAALVTLSMMGIDLGPMLAGLGIAGFVIGFALQDTLSNFASGIMIMVYRPFDVGDFVTAGGVTGEVKDLTLVSTVIRTLDNKRIMIPNGKVWGDVINNATAEKIRRVDLVFGISYGDDIDKARALLETILSEDERVLADPPPMVRVHNLGESSVDLFCRPWCMTRDYWDLYWDLTHAVKKRFDAEGVSFPFPQRDVHMYHEGGASTPL